MPLTTEYTTFTCDVLGRYIGNTFDEALITIDPNARAAAGLLARGDLRPFGVGGPRKDHLPQNEVWGLAWNLNNSIGFPSLA